VVTRYIYIAFLSDYNEKYSRGICFKDISGGISISNCVQTNEAPLRYAAERLCKNNLKIDIVIPVVTKKAYKDGGGNSSYKKFIHTLKGYINKTYEDVLMPIPDDVPKVYDENMHCGLPDDASVYEILRRVLDKLAEINKPNSFEDRIIIDTTGGYRNAELAIWILGGLLEQAGYNVEFSIYAQEPINVTGCGKLFDTTESDKIRDLIQAVFFFNKSGNPSEIENLIDPDNTPKGKSLKLLLSAMKEFYNSLMLCKADVIIKNIDCLNEKLDSFINITKQNTAEYNEGSRFDLKEVFGYFTETLIKTNGLFSNEKNEPKGITSEKSAFRFIPCAIRWCLNHGHMMQALALYCEKWPEYLFKSGKIKAYKEENPKEIVDVDQSFLYKICHNGKENMYHDIFKALLNQEILESEERFQKTKIYLKNRQCAADLKNDSNDDAVKVFEALETLIQLDANNDFKKNLNEKSGKNTKIKDLMKLKVLSSVNWDNKKSVINKIEGMKINYWKILWLSKNKAGIKDWGKHIVRCEKYITVVESACLSDILKEYTLIKKIRNSIFHVNEDIDIKNDVLDCIPKKFIDREISHDELKKMLREDFDLIKKIVSNAIKPGEFND